MTAQEFILDRMQELDRFRFDGYVNEAEYQDLMRHWRLSLVALQTPVSEWFASVQSANI